MLDIKAMLKTLKIIMHMVLKRILKGVKEVKAKKVISSGMSSFFQIIKQLIFSRDIDNS